MRALLAALIVAASAESHDKITQQEFESESKGKWVFLDMYAEW
jgi:hypothetical protein